MKSLKSLMAFNSSRFRLLKEIEAFAAMVPRGASVLDAGSGDAPYKNLFQHANYESADFQKADKAYAGATYVCDLRDIPVRDCRYDFIIFNQVLEHVPEPKQVLGELHRVIKKNGRLIYTGPLFYEEHEQPYDFYRYTQFGLKYLFSSVGFEIERLDWLEGYFGTAGYKLNCLARYLPRSPRDLGGGIRGYFLVLVIIPLKIVFGASSIFFHYLEKQIKYVGKGFPKNYVVIARK